MNRRRPAAPSREAARDGSARPPGGVAVTAGRALAWAGVAAVAAIALRLGAQAVHGTFSSDECFHAYASTWLLEHHTLPREFPAFYSGLYYYYHPFLHVLGAAWAGVLGAGALHVLPAVLFGALLALLVTGALGAVPVRAGRWAALACAPCAVLATYAVRLYVDVLVGLEFALAVALIARLWRGGRTPVGVLLGVVTGLALLTKFTGVGVPVLALACAAAAFARGRRRLAGQFAIACGVGVLIAAPWYARNQLLYGSAFYPAGAPDMDRALYALNLARFSRPPVDFLRHLPAVIGPVVGIVAIAALAAAAAARRFALAEGLLLAALAGMACTAFMPMAADRHEVPWLVIVAMAATWSLHAAVEQRPRAALGIEAVLVALAVVTAIRMPDYRAGANLPAALARAFPEVAARTPPDARILSLWTYDTAYYTGRDATWPNPWGQREHPVAMFRDTDPDSFRVHIGQSRIGWVLMPNAAVDVAFDSANYPESFFRCLQALVARGEAGIAWGSADVVLVRIGPRAARGR